MLGEKLYKTHYHDYIACLLLCLTSYVQPAVSMASKHYFTVEEAIKLLFDDEESSEEEVDDGDDELVADMVEEDDEIVALVAVAEGTSRNVDSVNLESVLQNDEVSVIHSV